MKVVLCCAALVVGAASVSAQAPIRGFPSSMLADQQKREQQLRAVPSADSLRARMRLLSEHPHEAGTERSRAVAELILARFKSFGLDARIERFEALMPRPLERKLELLGPEPYTAKLKEPGSQRTRTPTTRSSCLHSMPTRLMVM
jgi:N-acetylated-alpha-linked acidic dipeptidase